MKTALVLAGGGSRGAYELGVWSALSRLGIHPDIVTGTSIGSMNATLVAADQYEAARRLWLTLSTDEIFDYKHAIENKGVKFTGVREIMDEAIDEDYVRNSPIELGIVTVEFPNMKPLYLWKEDIPKGKLLDYVFASCACFPVVAPVEIDGKSYVDGGYADNVPIGMALEKNPDRLIVVDLDSFGVRHKEDFKEAEDKMIFIKCAWDLGNMAVFSPAHAEVLRQLGFLDTLKAFGVFTGEKYTFMRGQIPAKNLKIYEMAAELAGMDKTVIYSKDSFAQKLEEAIERNALKTEKVIDKFDLLDLATIEDYDKIRKKVAADLSKAVAKIDSKVNLQLDSDLRILIDKLLLK